MKLKFVIHNFVAASLVIGAACAVSSCKDNDADMYAQLTEKDVDLQKQINDLKTDIANCKEECHTTIINEVKNMFSTYDDQLWQKLGDKLALYATIQYVDNKFSNYYTKQEVDNLLKELADKIPSTAGFLTKEQVKALIEDAIKNLPPCKCITQEEIQKIIDDSLVPYVKKTDADNQYADKVAFQTFYNYVYSPEFIAYLYSQGLVKQEDLNDYAKEDDIKDYINTQLGDYAKLSDIENMVTYDDLNEYVKSDVLNQYLKIADLASYGYIDNAALVEALNNYVKTDDMAGYLAPYLKESDLASYLEPYLESGELQGEIDKLVAEGSTFSNLNEALSAISSLGSTVSAIDTTVKGIATDLSDLSGNVSDFKAAYDVFTANVSTQVTDIKSDIENLQQQIDAINGRLNNLITSIVCQQIYNPVFGTLTLPFDVTSNILLGYYGKTTARLEFPTSSTSSAYNGGDGYILTDEDLDFLDALNLASYDNFAPNQRLFDGNVGYVYLTVNPVANDFSGASFSLEKSNGEASVVKLDPIAASTDLISFGYSRAAANGFYEAKASVADSDVDKLKIDIESGLAQAVKDVAKNRTASDLANLGKLVYRQLDGFLPALAIKAAWTDGDKQNAVYSQYNIAATAFTPLSYSFLYDKSFKHDWKLPDWRNFEFDFSAPEMHFTVEEMYIDTSTLHFTYPTLDVRITIDNEADKLYIEVDMPTFDAEGHKIGTHKEKFYADNIDAFTTAYSDKLNEYFNNTLNAQVRAEFDRVIDDLVAQMKREVDKMMNNLNNQIIDNMDKVVADVNKSLNDKLSKYRGKLEKYITKVEDVIDRLNKFLEDPNHYLQPCMFYGVDGSSYGRMSTSKAFPTQAVLSGGNAITLIPSSYNAEIVCPAFRKFIAVTDVYTASASAQGGDAACKAALIDANKAQYMCQPIKGTQLTVPLKLTKVSGQNTTYEIAYQALDYHGTISTIKCYITVK